MTVGFQVSFDAADPRQLGQFWAAVLGYVEQPPPSGFDSWEAFLDSMDIPAGQRDSMYAVVDPDERLPRLLFQRVPEGKSAKNRIHLDVNVGAGYPPEQRTAAVRARADEILALGARELRVAEEYDEYWIVMADVEGNEFCVQ